MRNPGRWFRVALAFVATGIIACVAPFTLPAAWAGDGLRTGLMVYGLTAVIFGGVGALSARAARRAQDALQRGDDVIARWHVDGASWRAFLALDRTLDAAPGALPNELSVRDGAPEAGIDVIVGASAIQVDDSVHPLPRHGAPEVTRVELVSAAPDYIAMDLKYPGGGHGASGVPHGPTRLALRFPVAPGSWRDARRIVAHYGGLLPGEPDFFHGRGDGSDPEDLNTCVQCGFQTHQFRSECPRCGAGMMTRRWGRRFGALLAAGGAVILGIMAAVNYFTLPLLLHPGQRIGNSTFTGNRAQALLVLGVFAVVTAFGLAALGYGIWQARTGKRDLRVIYAMLGMWTLLLLVAYAI